ncbi:trehalose-phosphatase [Sphingomonas sp.]|uniref:trehalose-phosphatase n=1 Tax=Sphingomonas sp. TaxID=28214 RepID=UPI003B00F3D4
MLPPPPADLLDGAALFLDFDGTLVELAATPAAIVVPASLKALLPRLAAALDWRLAIVSGRAAHEIVRYLALDPAAPGIAIAGSHGLERVHPDGRREAPAPSAGVMMATAALRRATAAMPGAAVEEKPFGAALHYRLAPARAAECEALAERVAAETDLHLQRGKMVAELRMSGVDKGGAVAALLAEAPMRGHRPIFVGDDLTDEAGFRAADAAGGAGILVGEREGSAARYALPDVGAVVAWLERATG